MVHQQTHFKDETNREIEGTLLEFLEKDAKDREIQNLEHNTLILRSEIDKWRRKVSLFEGGVIPLSIHEK